MGRVKLSSPTISFRRKPGVHVVSIGYIISRRLAGVFKNTNYQIEQSSSPPRERNRASRSVIMP